MDKQTHDQLKKQFETMKKLSESGLLSLEEKNKLDEISAKLAGAMLSSWLPVGQTRKIIMLLLFFIGLYGVIKINFLFILLWLMLALFSPRVVGEVTIFLCKMFKK